MDNYTEEKTSSAMKISHSQGESSRRADRQTGDKIFFWNIGELQKQNFCLFCYCLWVTPGYAHRGYSYLFAQRSSWCCFRYLQYQVSNQAQQSAKLSALPSVLSLWLLKRRGFNQRLKEKQRMSKGKTKAKWLQSHTKQKKSVNLV